MKETRFEHNPDFKVVEFDQFGNQAENNSFKESEILELKKSTSELKEAIISVSSILNKHQKGELYFGINNDGTVVGQNVSEQTIRNISKTISDRIEPKIYAKINQVNLNGKDCIHVDFRGSDLPYFAYGRAYMRVGDDDRQLSAKELDNLILRKNKDLLRWDTQICNGAKITDIGSKKLKAFLKMSGLEYDTMDNSLKKLNLISDGILLNAAVILFGKKPQSFFPNAKLRCAIFGTTDTSFTIDMTDFEGDLFYLIEKAQEYILQNIHVGMRLEGLRRVDAVSYTHLRAHETRHDLVCRLLLEKKKNKKLEIKSVQLQYIKNQLKKSENDPK